MRILALISQLGPGGAERVFSRLLTYLTDRHEIMLMTWGGQPPFYPLSDKVTILRTDEFGPLKGARILGIAKRIAVVRRQVAYTSPDMVLSFMDTVNILGLTACIGLSVPVVVSERVDPHHHNIGRAKDAARRLLYPRARHIVAQTQRMANYFPKRLQKKISVIANPIDIPSLAAEPARPGMDGRFRIIAVGRLAPQKGFDGLLESFALLANRFSQWDLAIFGQGAERERLENYIRRHGLTNRVQLAGVTQNIHRELAKAHVMAFPSRYEGFPNALAEGLAAGLPAVGYAGVSGVEELILDGKTGLQVGKAQDYVAFAGALARLMADETLRTRLGVQARQHVTQWSPDRILRSWEKVLVAAAEQVPVFIP
jgi:GalNAc-alpha-(1->4)-GalNAc-alpha-(1->3)-diNAcBac-PP-undecaprenol alpha-1,4-N-acetyl-D-galactosaminyltransferase